MKIPLILILYSLIVGLYGSVIKLTSFFNEKAKLWVQGRKCQNICHLEKSIWIHCSSLGEFEQGRYLIEMIHTQMPQFPIVLTFFSPSGFEIRKKYEHANFVYYLPLDTKEHAKNFISKINPILSIFVKYDLWWNYLSILQRNNIPTILISAILIPNKYFIKFQPYNTIYNNLEAIFYQTQNSYQLALKSGVRNPIISGDTRVDRANQLSKFAEDVPEIVLWRKQFENQKVIIGGSVWHKEVTFLSNYSKDNPDVCLIIAPHDISDRFLKFIETSFSHTSVDFWTKDSSNLTSKIIVIDVIGLLSRIYKYGNFAVIGGGFRSGIHNTLEPIAQRLPVIFGPNYKKFQEAIYLVKNGGGVTFIDQISFDNALNIWLNNDIELANASQNAFRYIVDNQGSSEQIFNYIRSNIIENIN